MGDPWKDTIRDMAKWLMKDHPFMFAHIQGQPAIAKAIRVPLFLQDSFCRSNSNAEIIHITNATKKDQVFKEREKLRANMRLTTQTAKSIRTMDYLEATNMLKIARRENGWHLPDIGKNACAVVVIIEADPGYSAEYALALIAWTTMIKRHSTSSGRMRLMTMSWEGLHDMTKAIWNYWPAAKEPLREYVLPSIARGGGRVISNSKTESATSEMMSWVQKIAPNGTHTCVSFRRPTSLDESWDPCYQHHHQDLDSAIKPRRTLFINIDFKTAERIPDAGKPHLLTSTTRRRLIFDLETRQPITVTTECSSSEEKQQMSWVHRFSGESTNIYTQPGFCYGAKCHRRMRFADEQLGGFLAALSELDKWPLGISNVTRLSDHREEDSQVAIDIEQRLIRQGILQHDSKSTTGLSLALPKESHPSFYNILPLVEYDHRLALFLSLKSKNPMVNTAKAQMAAIISGSNTNCFEFAYKIAPEVHETSGAARIGLLKHVAHTGTVMKGLGLIKTAISASRFSMLLPEIYIVDKQVRVYMDEVKHVMERCRLLLQVLSTCGYNVDEAMPFTQEEPEGIEFDDFMEVWTYLLRAYTYQIALVSVTKHGEVFIKDLVSQTRLEASFEVQHCFEWETIPKDKWDYAVGIYTRASRERGRTTIKDWNWIPPEVWDRWGAELPGGVEGLRTKFKLAKNHDESMFNLVKAEKDGGNVRIKFIRVAYSSPFPLTSSLFLFFSSIISSSTPKLRLPQQRQQQQQAMSKSNQPEGEAASGGGPSSDHGGHGRGRGGNRGGYNNGHGNYQAHGSIRQSNQGPSTTEVAPAGPSQAIPATTVDKTPVITKRDRIRIAAENSPLDYEGVAAAMDAVEIDLPEEFKLTEEAAVTSDKQEVVTRNE
ncbi:hypothetical protein F25303_9519 [Fusarium sp. NRRL 25303]|nr:hypothetical protein F25303_9519 [Fusarium sp. NRRL 25303]